MVYLTQLKLATFQLSFKRSTKVVCSQAQSSLKSCWALSTVVLRQMCWHVVWLERLYIQKMVWMSKRCKNKFSRSATSVESSPTAGWKNEKNVEAQLTAVALLLLEPINQKASDAASSIEQSLQRVGRCRNRVCGPRDSQIHVLGTKAHTTTTKRVQRLKFAVGEKINVELLQEKSSGPLWCKKTKKSAKA